MNDMQAIALIAARVDDAQQHYYYGRKTKVQRALALCLEQLIDIAAEARAEAANNGLIYENGNLVRKP